MKILLARMDKDEQRDSTPCNCCDKDTPAYYIDTRILEKVGMSGRLADDKATWVICEECIRGQGVVLDTEDEEATKAQSTPEISK